MFKNVTRSVELARPAKAGVLGHLPKASLSQQAVDPKRNTFRVSRKFSYLTILFNQAADLQVQ